MNELPITLQDARRRTGLSVSSLRSMKDKGYLIEGVHWFKPLGTVIMLDPLKLNEFLRSSISQVKNSTNTTKAKKTIPRTSPVLMD